jgi:hypothetical protein
VSQGPDAGMGRADFFVYELDVTGGADPAEHPPGRIS